VVKIRGFTLNSHTSKKIHFGSLRKIVQDFCIANEVGEGITIDFPQIMRQKNRTVVNQTSKKTYKPRFTKRARLDPEDRFISYPYGWKG